MSNRSVFLFFGEGPVNVRGNFRLKNAFCGSRELLKIVFHEIVRISQRKNFIFQQESICAVDKRRTLSPYISGNCSSGRGDIPAPASTV